MGTTPRDAPPSHPPPPPTKKKACHGEMEEGKAARKAQAAAPSEPASALQAGPRAAGGVGGRRLPLSPPRRSRRLTFDGDDMLADLVLQHRLLHPLQQLVDGVDVGVHRLEALDLGPDGCRVGQLLLVVHGAAAPLRRRRRRPLRSGAFPRPSPPHREPRAGRRAAAGGGGARRGRAPTAAASLTGLPPAARPGPARPGSSPSPRSPQGAPPPPPLLRPLSLHRGDGARQAGRPRPHGGRQRGDHR